MINRKVYVVGGGSYGSAAQIIAGLCRENHPEMDVILRLTQPEGPSSSLGVIEDLERLALEIIEDRTTKLVFFSAVVGDFSRESAGDIDERNVLRLFRKENPFMEPRKDITLVGINSTRGASEKEQYVAALHLLKGASCNLVLAVDTETGVHMIVVPEEAKYCVTTDREKVLAELVETAFLRSHLTFTRSTVVDGQPVPWESPEVPSTLRAVVNHCIGRGAYKRFRGVTAGHFAVKISNDTFLTSRRKTDFNDLADVGLVKVKTDGPDSVIAFGSKPSVGGQSQRIVFSEHPEYDCIVHFHCPIRTDSSVPTVSQREYECGSHECGRNTSRGLAKFGELSAVYLDQHGPNIAFHNSIDPQKVIDFIEANFALEEKTGGYVID
jgi:hypothetical protein